MNVKRTLINTLETTFANYPVYLQGTLNSADAYPDNFITVWTTYTANDGYYDDEPFAFAWNFTVMFYSKDPALIATVPAQISAALKAAGFIPQGKGNDIPSDTPTHTGWVLEFMYKEISQSEV